nr:uncharacterized protein LOC109155576 [Ipomoea batatas]GME17085.1 uncharacterized protein LOC109155576 [Ipomoea batatas]
MDIRLRFAAVSSGSLWYSPRTRIQKDLKPSCSRRDSPQQNGDNGGDRGDKLSTDWDKAWASFKKRGKKNIFSQFSDNVSLYQLMVVEHFFAEFLSGALWLNPFFGNSSSHIAEEETMTMKGRHGNTMDPPWFSPSKSCVHIVGNIALLLEKDSNSSLEGVNMARTCLISDRQFQWLPVETLPSPRRQRKHGFPPDEARLRRGLFSIS